MKKSILSTAVLAAMNVTWVAQAANITSLSIADWGGDYIAGGFAFASGVSAASKYTHFFDSTTGNSSVYLPNITTSGAGITGGEQGYATSADNSFTTGFFFTG